VLFIDNSQPSTREDICPEVKHRTRQYKPDSYQDPDNRLLQVSTITGCEVAEHKRSVTYYRLVVYPLLRLAMGPHRYTR
jgi:hypothetical protein